MLVIAVGFVFRKTEEEYEDNVIQYSQMHLFNMIGPYILPSANKQSIIPRTQLSNYYQEEYVRIAVLDEYAYWITDNTFYMADMDGDDVLKDTARVVDTMSMDKVQLSKIAYIVEVLSEGNNDSGNPRKSQL